MSSLAVSTENVTPSNDAPSLNNISCDIEHGANSPTRKERTHQIHGTQSRESIIIIIYQLSKRK